MFYVYEHWRPDRDECFYVGKGMGGRANKMRDRNLHHRAIVKKLSALGMAVEVRMVATGLDEETAFEIEVERIAFWRAAGIDLANKTNGGDGVSGLPAYNRKPVISLETGEIFESASAAGRRFNILGSSVAEACSGRSEAASGLRFAYICSPHLAKDPVEQARKRKKSTSNSTNTVIENGRDRIGRSAAGPASASRMVVCVDTGDVFPSASAAAKHFDVCKSSLIELCLGKNGRRRVGGLVFKYGDT
jgi:hypothetical protein